MTVDALTVLHGDALELDDTVEVGSTALDVRFARSEDGRAWLDWSDVSSVDALRAGTALEFLESRLPEMAEATRRRRAQTLERWREALSESR